MTDTQRVEQLTRSLESLGDARTAYTWEKSAVDYVQVVGLSEQDVPALCEIATVWATRTEWPEDREDTTVFAPVHAWRAMGQLASAQAVEPCIALLKMLMTEDRDDDFFSEDFPHVIARIGEAGIEPTAALLDDDHANEWARAAAAGALGNVALAHPELRDACVAALARTFERHEEVPDTVNANILAALIDNQATELGDLIERAHAADAIDISVCGNWQKVRGKMGLADHGLVPAELAEASPFAKYPAVEQLRTMFQESREMGNSASASRSAKSRQNPADRKKRKRRSR